MCMYYVYTDVYLCVCMQGMYAFEKEVTWEDLKGWKGKMIIIISSQKIEEIHF